MSPQELFLVTGLLVAVINGAALSVGIGILGNQGQFCYPAFCRLYRGKGAVPLICQSGQFVFQRLIGLWISAYFPSSYVAVCAPFIFRFLLVQIGRLLNLPNGLRLDRLLVARGTIYSDFVTLVVTTATVLVLIFLCYRLFMKRMERRIWDVE